MGRCGVRKELKRRGSGEVRSEEETEEDREWGGVE